MINTFNIYASVVSSSSKAKVHYRYGGESTDQQTLHTSIYPWLTIMSLTKDEEGYQHLDCFEEEGHCFPQDDAKTFWCSVVLESNSLAQ